MKLKAGDEVKIKDEDRWFKGQCSTRVIAEVRDSTRIALVNCAGFWKSSELRPLTPLEVLRDRLSRDV